MYFKYHSKNYIQSTWEYTHTQGSNQWFSCCKARSLTPPTPRGEVAPWAAPCFNCWANTPQRQQISQLSPVSLTLEVCDVTRDSNPESVVRLLSVYFFFRNTKQKKESKNLLLVRVFSCTLLCCYCLTKWLHTWYGDHGKTRRPRKVLPNHWGEAR